MHIPDGFIDAKTIALTSVLSAAGVGGALYRLKRSLLERRVPLLGLSAAFIFAAQMLNFPVAGGTSGHLIGGALAVVLLGPSAAVIVLCSVLILQCFLFADGGITALGANIFNMAIVSVVVAGAVHGFLGRMFGGKLRGRLTATGFAAWTSTVAASVACAGELALSGTAPWRVVFPAMVHVHMVIGAGEALMTTLIVAAVARLRPELFSEVTESSSPGRSTELVFGGLLTAIGLAIFVAPVACGWPDGLEKIAETLGFHHRAAKALIAAPLPGYVVPGLRSVMFSTVVAGGFGTLAAFGLAYGLARFLTPLEKKQNVYRPL